jgi:glycosyltransferase involved in cell wall biosynthesis
VSIETAMAGERAGSESPSPLRILQVAASYYPAVRYGGPIRSVHGLAAALARRGHDVHVYTTNVDGDSLLDVPVDRPVLLDGVKVHYFPVPALKRLWWSPALERQLRDSIADFDVLHVHAVYLLPMRAAARAAARAGVPYVISPRGMLIRELIRRKSRWVKTAWINLIERTTLAQAAAVHVTADVEGTEFRAMRLPYQRIVCIPNGVDFPAEHTPLEQGPFATLPERYVLFLSRINWKKGLDRLITAWQWVPDLPLVIAGNDDENYRPRLEELARSAGVADRVIFLGPVSDAHKWALYQRAQLFVLPSYSENFGNVVAEAMAMGCPTVVTPEVGIAPLLESTGAGRVVSGAPEELAAAIGQLLADPAARREMGRRGAEAARDRLSWPGIATEAERLYREVLRQKAELAAAA